MKIKRLEKLLLFLSPKLGFKRLAKKMGIKNIVFDKAHELFANIEHIDIIPTHSENRGFIMILDGQTALYFYQDGDHFSYDGYEMGEYDKGDVTIFDHLK
jgi:hypothetical protein